MGDFENLLSEGSEAKRKEELARSARAMQDVLLELKTPSRAFGVSGMTGSAKGRLVAELVRAGHRPVIVVTPDEGSAEDLEHDVRFFLGPDRADDAPRLLRIPADETLPYDDLSNERDATLQRLRAQFHLHMGTRVDAVVLSVKSLARKVLPRSVVDTKMLLLATDQDVAIETLRKQLVEAGYENVPLVEDPGSFAVRGGIVDIFSPLYAKPARIDFFGDTIETISFFDTDTQRTVDETKELSICLARETLFDDATKASVKEAIRTVADEVSRPTSKVRELLEEVEEGVPAFGIDAMLPGFFAGGLEPISAYFPATSVVVLDDPLEVQRCLDDLDSALATGYEHARGRLDLALPPKAHFLSADEVFEWVAGRKRIELQSLVMGGARTTGDIEAIDTGDGEIPAALRRSSNGIGTAPLVARFRIEQTDVIRREIEAHHGETGALEPLWKRLSEWRQTGVAAIIACHSGPSAEKLRRMLLDRNVSTRIVPWPLPDDPRSLYQASFHAHLVVQELSEGFIDHAGGFAIVTDADVFGERVERKVRRAKTEQPFVAAFRDLKEGDLVVHVDHGICRYEGLTKLQVRGFHADFLVLHFSGRDKLYLPVHRLRQIQKYVGGDPEKVKLDSLQSTAFAKRKERVKEEVLKMAGELLDLYAARKAHPGFAFAAPDEMFRQFENDFEFDETPDQEKAINAVLADMRKKEPMDRLVCGDVGYGKTEVAMRATFKAIEDKKQVAILVPTTVLAAQHYRTFAARMKDYPVTVEMVSRFRDAKENKDVLRRLAEGRVDVVVGTHRLLSPDVNFKDLGLVVVDEEHRFGVKHKEALKHYRRSVDFLTLTATPIPRTLNMSLAGVRDMSIIATPPTDRRAIRTFVVKFEPGVIKESIERELARGGQVYFLHNRVDSIEEIRHFLQELVPKARIGVGHGQMGEGELEQVMTDFVEKRFDVLLCTTIIESGLDIPSANTMLVNRADTFGLAQLYQIRGRVGRSRERAYCYLFVPAERPVTKDAKKRLQVLQQFTELGAGFHIASHDMEIRGAGNLLGPDQSGSIAAIGFDLYAEMLDDAVRELRGEAPRDEIDPEVTLAVPSYIPDSYVEDVQQRLLFYKRLAQAGSDDELLDVRAELADRFGDPPEETENLVKLMSLKVAMRRLKIRALESGPGRLVVTMGNDATLDPVRMAQLVARSKDGLRLTPDMKLLFPAEGMTEPSELLEAAERMMRALSGIRALA